VRGDPAGSKASEGVLRQAVTVTAQAAAKIFSQQEIRNLFAKERTVAHYIEIHLILVEARMPFKCLHNMPHQIKFQKRFAAKKANVVFSPFMA